jgi:hypothetical protein
MTADAPRTSAKATSRWLLGKAAIALGAAEGDRRASARATPERRVLSPATRLLPIVVAALLCRPATANGTAAELATGGIVLTKNADIEMLLEHLHISTRQIRIRYRFYNTSPKDVMILVAFPMPDITVEDSTANISIPTGSPAVVERRQLSVSGPPPSQKQTVASQNGDIRAVSDRIDGSHKRTLREFRSCGDAWRYTVRCCRDPED